MVVTWPDEVDDVLGGDLTCALACNTDAGGAVVSAVAPIGLRDRERGTVGVTTSLGFGRKLLRIKKDPRVALAYHARTHGLADPANQRFVLVQGLATFDPHPDRAALDTIGEQATPYLGPPRRGPFWDRWLSAYYADRVLVTVEVRRIIVWPDLLAAGEPEVFGEPMPANPPAPQKPPAKGTAPRVDTPEAAHRAAKLPHHLIAYRQSDGYPAILPFTSPTADPDGLRISVRADLPPGGRRAGILSHDYRPKLIGLETRQHTGWLDVADGQATYAPHTASGFVAPPNKTLLLLANGFLARRGLRQAAQDGLLDALA
ncbi:hypothetical protein [Nocardia concava]|uniref:hypothetical protein n=1 Tax=Nocardia concava TaxID=257281 RepID=UPI0005939A7C|nr:hypothetical protein [Nocardia concava]